METMYLINNTNVMFVLLVISDNQE